jgi:hypothetical protein
MRVVLSRKGFDSHSGGKPSPILPDGRLVSLPIPSPAEKLCYSDLHLDGRTYQALMDELGYKRFPTCHLDPDLRRSIVPRLPGWKPIFGQIDAAQGHLDNQGIGAGDLFLFFGWFRHTRLDRAGKLVFDPADREGKHMIFGYLQVDAKIRMNVPTPCPAWMAHHPHAELHRRQRKNNTLYVARDTCAWDNRLPAAGVFCYDASLVLSKPGMTKRCWELPNIFRGLAITYHSDTSWQADHFVSAGRGQEFVVEQDEQVEGWAKGLIQNNRVW